MNEVHGTADNLFTEIEHLERVLGPEDTPENVELALSVAKRVRRTCTLLVQALAAHRDNLKP